MKRVKCVETGKIWESLKEAGRETGVSPTKISANLTGKASSADGLHFAYAPKDEINEEPKLTLDDRLSGKDLDYEGRKRLSTFVTNGLMLLDGQVNPEHEENGFFEHAVKTAFKGCFLVIVGAYRDRIAEGGWQGLEAEVPELFPCLLDLMSRSESAQAMIRELNETGLIKGETAGSQVEQRLTAVFRITGTKEAFRSTVGYAAAVSKEERFRESWRELIGRYEAFEELRRSLAYRSLGCA